MRRLEVTRPSRTATGKARNAGEAAQQLAHITRERLRIGQERRALLRRIQKIDARFVALSALEDTLVPMIRQEADRARTVRLPAVPAAPVAAAMAAPPPIAPSLLPVGTREATLQY